MAATDRDIIEFFALSGNNPVVSATDLQDMKDWLTESRGLEEEATADDLVDAVYRTLDQQTFAKKRRDHMPTRIGNQP